MVAGFRQFYGVCDAREGVETEAIAEKWGRSSGVKLPGGGMPGVQESHPARR